MIHVAIFNLTEALKHRKFGVQKPQSCENFTDITHPYPFLSHICGLKNHIYDPPCGGGNSPMKRARTWSSQPLKDQFRILAFFEELFQFFLKHHPYLGKNPIFTSICQRG